MPKHKSSSKKPKQRKLIINQIEFEILEVEINESDQHQLSRDFVVETNVAYLKKHPGIKSVKLKDHYSITTPEGEGKVLAESIRVLLYVYGQRNLAEMMSSFATFLQETRLEDSSNYNFLIPEFYFERFFELDPEAEDETFDEAIEKAKTYADFSGLKAKEDNEEGFNAYEIEEYGGLSRRYFDEAGIINYVLDMWNNSDLEEFLSSYYFI